MRIAGVDSPCGPAHHDGVPPHAVVAAFENVHKSFAGFPALKGVSFDLREGEIFGFIGPNGAGKTTTMRILVGLLTDFDGSLTVNGQSMPGHRDSLYRTVGYMPQGIAFQDWRTVDPRDPFPAPCEGQPRAELPPGRAEPRPVVPRVRRGSRGRRVSLRLMYADELSGFARSRVMLVLWVGMPVLALLLHTVQPDLGGQMSLTVFSMLVISTMASTIAAAMLSVGIVNEKTRGVYALFLVRPVRRRSIILGKFLAVVTCVGVAAFLTLAVGLLYDSLRGGAPGPALLR